MVSNQVLPRYVLSSILCAYLLWRYSNVTLGIFACLAFQPREEKRHILGHLKIDQNYEKIASEYLKLTAFYSISESLNLH
jgi:hypothetical protein